MIQRRLDATERQEVKSGAVFIWEERSAAATGNDVKEEGGKGRFPFAFLFRFVYSAQSFLTPGANICRFFCRRYLWDREMDGRTEMGPLKGQG